MTECKYSHFDKIADRHFADNVIMRSAASRRIFTFSTKITIFTKSKISYQNYDFYKKNIFLILVLTHTCSGPIEYLKMLDTEFCI